MHLVYASKEVLKIRLRCNPSTKIEKPKTLRGGVSFLLKIYVKKKFLYCMINFVLNQKAFLQTMY